MGSRGIQPHHAAILDVDARHAVARGGNDEGVIEAHFERAGLDFAVPVRFAVAQAQVPLSHAPGGVARLLEHGRERRAARLDDQGGVAGQNPGAGFAERVFPGHERVARRRAGGRRRMAVGEAHAARRQPVHVGSLHARGAVAAKIAVADIVGQDHHDVPGAPGLRGGGPRRRAPATGQPEKGSSLHREAQSYHRGADMRV